jgi:hypothetical protein
MLSPQEGRTHARIRSGFKVKPLIPRSNTRARKESGEELQIGGL